MSAFVVRFVGDAVDSFRGRVRHVATGEETTFSSIAELLAFFEGMNALSGLGAPNAEFAGADCASRAPPTDPIAPRVGRRSRQEDEATRREGSE